MALPASDNFDRANGNMGSNWTQTGHLGAGSQAAVISGNAVKPAAGANGAFAYWNADSFPNDQFAQLDMVWDSYYSTGSAGPGLRATPGTGTTYGGYGLRAISNSARIVYSLGGLIYQIANLGTWANATYRLQMVGSTLSCKKNGAAFGTSYTDSHYASGPAGVWTQGTDSSAYTSSDNWSAGDASAGTPVTGTGAVTLKKVTASAAGSVDNRIPLNKRRSMIAMLPFTVLPVVDGSIT